MGLHFKNQKEYETALQRLQSLWNNQKNNQKNRIIKELIVALDKYEKKIFRKNRIETYSSLQNLYLFYCKYGLSDKIIIQPLIEKEVYPLISQLKMSSRPCRVRGRGEHKLLNIKH